MIKNLIQTTLDDILYSKDIFVYEQRKSGKDANQYVVYSMSGDNKEEFVDDKVLIKNANVTIKYYYRSENLDNYTTRQEIREIEQLIESALESAGFEIPYGSFDGGDVDNIGYHTTIFECEYWRVV